MAKTSQSKGTWPVSKVGNDNVSLFQEFHRTGITKRTQGLCNLVQPLAQRFGRRDFADTKGFSEVVVFSTIADRLVIALTRCEQANITAQEIVKADAVASGTEGKSLPGLGRHNEQNLFKLNPTRASPEWDV